MEFAGPKHSTDVYQACYNRALERRSLQRGPKSLALAQQLIRLAPPGTTHYDLYLACWQLIDAETARMLAQAHAGGIAKAS